MMRLALNKKKKFEFKKVLNEVFTKALLEKDASKKIVTEI